MISKCKLYNILSVFVYSSFFIIIQPSVPECVAATKYEKTGSNYTAKLKTRIICLLEPLMIENHFTLSNVGKNINYLELKTNFQRSCKTSYARRSIGYGW